MKYPVNATTIAKKFPALKIDTGNIEINHGLVQEATVYGRWSASRLSNAFREAGFRQTGKKSDMSFVDESGMIGLVCYGLEVDAKSNRFKTLYFEIQARSKEQVAKGITPLPVM